MTKAEAIQALHDGKRLSHRLFLPREFIEEKEGYYADEKGKPLAVPNFWRWRKGVYWDCDWYEYKEQNTEA